MDIFAKKSAIINTRVPLKNYKKYDRRNWSQNKNRTDIFETDDNAGVEKNNENIVNFDYSSDNI